MPLRNRLFDRTGPAVLTRLFAVAVCTGGVAMASGNGEAEGEAGAFASAADQLFAGDNDWVN